MKLEPLYRLHFTYPEGWAVGLGGGWEQHLYVAEGRCDGSISGRFRGADFPRRREDGTFRPDFRAVIETTTGRRSCSSGTATAVPTRSAPADRRGDLPLER
jgi:Protein of unknown function (DUF3237)